MNKNNNDKGQAAKADSIRNSELNGALGLCDRCHYRQDSIRRCIEYLDAGRTGMILDPQPKYECKMHTLYAGELIDHQKQQCSDFRPKL